MKILMLSQGLPFPIYRDGLTIRVYHLLKELSHKASCHLISLADYPLGKEDEAELRTMASYDIISYTPESGAIGTIKKIISKRRYYSPAFAAKVRECIASFCPDVVLAEQTFMAQYVDDLAGTPAVISAVDAISLAAIRQSHIHRNPLKKLAWKYVAFQRLAIERKYFRKFGALTVVGEEDADFLRHRVGLEVLTIPNGVDTEFFAPRPHGSRVAVLFSGNLAAPMNEEACLYLLRQVFPQLHSQHRDLEFVIAGRGPTQKIRDALPPFVTLRPDIADMRDAMQDTMLYLSPIRYGTGIKNNVLQAMSMGIPVVVTPLIAGPIRITSSEEGLVAERGKEFLEAIEIALNDPLLREQIGNRGRNHVVKFYSWAGIASEYFKLFEKILASKRSKGLPVLEKECYAQVSHCAAESLQEGLRYTLPTRL